MYNEFMNNRGSHTVELTIIFAAVFLSMSLLFVKGAQVFQSAYSRLLVLDRESMEEDIRNEFKEILFEKYL